MAHQGYNAVPLNDSSRPVAQSELLSLGVAVHALKFNQGFDQSERVIEFLTSLRRLLFMKMRLEDNYR